MSRFQNSFKMFAVLTLILSASLQFSGAAIATEKKSQNTNVYHSMGKNDQTKLIQFLYQFTNIYEELKIEKDNDEDIVRWLYDGIHSSNLKFAPELVKEKNKKLFTKDGDFYYTPYPASKVNAFLKRTLGFQLEKRNYYSSDKFLLILYKNNSYYILEPNYGGGEEFTVAQPDYLYSIGNNRFYVKFKKYSFAYDTFEESGLSYKLAFNPKHTWSSKVKAMSYEEKGGFAVVEKVVSGKTFSWRLVRFNGDSNGLTDQQIKELQKK
ncbi:hypothetical protein [Paenibacillus xylanilyticus]|uniref:Uncharacterized protein n=1 Tax=Paenibacillus xylanilyticus TaxID=248903 RepID=A0A7Y6BTS8_9BACL|nr:hypothetical protein [Paenibacillus xylanilyticus]NUU74661.1 hypothetical protein [Paenibacillus xylanilyticus]